MQSGCKMPKIPTTPPDRHRVGVVLPFSYQFTCGLAPGGEPYRNVTVEITVLRPLNMNNPPTLTQFDFQTYVVNNDDTDPDNLEFYAYVPKEGPVWLKLKLYKIAVTVAKLIQAFIVTHLTVEIEDDQDGQESLHILLRLLK